MAEVDNLRIMNLKEDLSFPESTFPARCHVQLWQSPAVRVMELLREQLLYLLCSTRRDTQR